MAGAQLLRDKESPIAPVVWWPNARCSLLASGSCLRRTAATAVACFVLGALLMLAISLPLFRARPAAVHVLVLGVLLAGGLTKLVGGHRCNARGQWEGSRISRDVQNLGMRDSDGAQPDRRRRF